MLESCLSAKLASKHARKRKLLSASLTPFETEEESHDTSCDGIQLGHLCEMREGGGQEQSCDSHTTLGKDPKPDVQDV